MVNWMRQRHLGMNPEVPRSGVIEREIVNTEFTESKAISHSDVEHMLSRLRAVTGHLSLPRAQKVLHLVPQTCKMSTFVLPDFVPECPVKLTKDLDEAQLLNFVPFKTWMKTLKRSLEQQSEKSHPFHEAPYKLRSIDIQSVDFFGKGQRIGFIKLSVEVTNDKGEYLPGSVFLRGGSVAMMV